MQSLAACAAVASEVSVSPNIVLAFSDDHGFGDAGWNNPQVEMPHLDPLARDGVHLDRFCVNPIGSVTRAALMSGIATLRTGVNNHRGLNPTIAVMAQDNADPKTGMEYANTSIGDGGFLLKFGDGPVTDASWKAKAFSQGPIDRDTRNPRVENISIPANWYAIDFDDRSWGHAKEFTEAQVGQKQPFFEHDFKGARFIWSDDLDLDNTVLFRHVVKSPPDGRTRVADSNLNNVVPGGPPKKPK